jgi:hypothetical protein
MKIRSSIIFFKNTTLSFFEIGKIFLISPKETISFNASDIIAFDEHKKFEIMS